MAASAPDPVRWEQFAMLGDEFIVGYSKLDAATPAATLFNVGHAAELYLKALLLKDDPNAAVEKFGHKLDVMLAELRKARPTTFAPYDLRPSVYTKFMNPLVPIRETADPDFLHYVQNQELYWVARYLADMKYLGTLHKKMPDTFNVFCCPCNPYWLEFFSMLRRELGWPIKNMWFDAVARYIARPQLDLKSVRFLEQLPQAVA